MQRILIVDDDPLNVRLIQVALLKNGYEVDFAQDGVQGLAKIQSFHPDLIILDVEMPQMNGYTFILETKKIEASAEIPIIVLTAHAQMQAIFQMKGVKDYMIKPVETEDLIAKIRTHIS